MIDRSKVPASLQSFPSPFLRALMHDSYVPGTARFSVTGLLSPPKRTWLKTLGEEIRSPYSMFSALMGTAIHHVIETHVDEESGEIAEQRFYSLIEVDGEQISVSGQVDLIENKVVTDFKNTSGTQERPKNDHILQAHMNGLLAERNGIEVENVSIVYIDRTWSHMRSTVDPTYPKTPFRIFVQPYDRQLAIDTFARTVRDHHEASLGRPRECTSEEMWEKPTTYALKKPGASRASKLCDSMAEAQELQKPGQIIEARPGDRVFCSSFCGLSHLCQSHQAYLRKLQSTEEP